MSKSIEGYGKTESLFGSLSFDGSVNEPELALELVSVEAMVAFVRLPSTPILYVCVDYHSKQEMIASTRKLIHWPTFWATAQSLTLIAISFLCFS
jgi:hypothetical protein